MRIKERKYNKNKYDNMIVESRSNDDAGAFLVYQIII